LPWDPNADTWVRTLALSGDLVFAGGSFRGVSGLPQSYLAAIGSVPISVQVENLSAVQAQSGVLLAWRLSAAAVRDLLGVVVQRGDAPAGPFEPLSPSPLAPAVAMTFADDAVIPARTYWYRLALPARDGTSTVSPAVQGIAGGGSDRRTEPRLESVQVHTDHVEIRFVVGHSSLPVELSVYDIAGRRVWALDETVPGPGEHVVIWDRRSDGGLRVPRGIYLLRFQAQRASTAKKMILLED
jgi:hypothetical protein